MIISVIHGYIYRFVKHIAKDPFFLQCTWNSFIVLYSSTRSTPIISRITPMFLGLKLRVFWIKNNPFREGTHTAGFPRRRVFHPGTGQGWSNPLIFLFVPLSFTRVSFSSPPPLLSLSRRYRRICKRFQKGGMNYSGVGENA